MVYAVCNIYRLVNFCVAVQNEPLFKSSWKTTATAVEIDAAASPRWRLENCKKDSVF
jgi:hypothetical protein